MGGGPCGRGALDNVPLGKGAPCGRGGFKGTSRPGATSSPPSFIADINSSKLQGGVLGRSVGSGSDFADKSKLPRY